MTDVISVATIPRIQARTAAGRDALLQGGGLPPVAAEVGIPGRPGPEGPPGRAGPPGPPGEATGELADPGDLTLIFDNKLI